MGPGKALPLRWGFGGPIIGSAIVKEDGTVEGVIADKKYVDILKPDIPQEYSIVGHEDLFGNQTKKEEN